MPDDLLEDYIAQHLQASPDEVIRFSWHGGEPTVLGLDYFRKIVDIQRRHRPAGRTIANGMQTNGTLLDEDWCAFLAAEGFSVGLSLDGPRELNDRNRLTRDQESTFERTMRGYDLLRRHGIPTDILCVVSAPNARHPLEVYRFFKAIGAGYVTFLPLVTPCPEAEGGVSPDTVSAEAWGEFLCQVFDEWVRGDIGRIKVQTIEEAARTAFGQEHSLCLFRPECGDIPVSRGMAISTPAITSSIGGTGSETSPGRRSSICSTARLCGTSAGTSGGGFPGCAGSAGCGTCATGSVRRTASSGRPTAAPGSTTSVRATAASSNACDPSSPRWPRSGAGRTLTESFFEGVNRTSPGASVGWQRSPDDAVHSYSQAVNIHLVNDVDPMSL